MRRCAALVVTGLLVCGAGVAVPGASASAGRPAAHAAAGNRPSSQRSARLDPAALVRRSGRTLAPAVRGVATGTLGRRVLDPRAATLRAGRNGQVTVSVTGAAGVVAGRLHDLGGRVLATSGGVSSVLVAKSRLAELSRSAGITAVRAPIHPHIAAGATSEGVQASQADAWHTASTDGSGVVIGIVDAGFTGLAAAQQAGDLPDDVTVVNEDCVDGGEPSTDTSEHGTAVAEIAHQMAPAAGLYLFCVGTNVGFAAASRDIQAINAKATSPAKIKIVSSSLGFSDDGRGDGTGASSGDGISTAYAVKQARRSGILWIQSAGNNAENHWSGKLTDADSDGLVDIDGTYDEAKGQFEDDVSFVAGATGGGPTFADIELQWDQWPTTNSAVTLESFGFQCTTPYESDGSCGEYPITADANGVVHKVPGADPDPVPTTVKHTAGSAPYAEIDMQNTSQYEQYWVVYVVVNSAYPTIRYDLTYQGDVDGPSYLACAAASDTGCTSISPRSYQSSLSAPASSPYALAVGAADVGADGVPRGTLEPFSSQGPTIDARTKPDITAWDGVSSPVYGAPSETGTDGFYGTSAAAPHVAGAAALVLQANPSLDAAQLQNFLEQRASRGTGTGITESPYNPPNNQFGHGLLTVGATPINEPVISPVGSSYTAVTPVRLLDTRTPVGGHQAALGAGGRATITLPASTPADATAVAVNITGIGSTGASNYLSAYPAGTAAPSTSNVNLGAKDRTAAGFAIVSLPSTPTKKIIVRNSSATVNVAVDEVGYFGTGAESGRLTSLSAPKRVLDTRTAVGGHHSTVGNGKTVTVRPGAPAGARAAIVNITVAGPASSGYVSAAPTCSRSTSTLNYGTFTRANLAIVQLAGTTPGFCLENAGPAVNLVVDVVGYMTTAGSLYVPLPSSQRIVDTRNGNGGSALGKSSRPLGAAITTGFYGSSVGDVPANATALFTGVVEASTTTGAYLALFPGKVTPSSVSSSLNFSAGRIVANAAVVGLSSRYFGIYNNAGSTQTAVDLFGYFAPAPAA